MANKISIVFLLSLSIAAVIATDDIILEMRAHIKRLDARIEHLEERDARQNAEIESLRENAKTRETELVQKIDELDTRVEALEDENNVLKGVNGRPFQNITGTEWDGDSGKSNNEKTRFHLDAELASAMFQKFLDKRQEAAVYIGNRGDATRPRPYVRSADDVMARPRRALPGNPHVAFSAYMDHNADQIPGGSGIVFNQVLTNDGNGYSNMMGTFTAPVAGVYYFTLFVGERGDKYALVGLFANSIVKVDVIVETVSATHDSQAGNAAILKLARGDVVYVKNDGRSTHIESSATYRFTTFSGFLIYSTEDGSHVVG